MREVACFVAMAKVRRVRSDNAVVEKWMHKGKMHVTDRYDSAAVLRRRHAVDFES